MSAHGGRGGRRMPEEEHVNHERWLVTYADMITLLMVLFIVLFAMSTVDQKKFNALKSGLAVGFGGSPSILDGSSGIMREPGTEVKAAIAPTAPGVTPPAQQRIDDAITRHDAVREQRRYAEAQAEVDRLEELIDRLFTALRAHGLQDDVRAMIDQRGLVLSLVSKHVTFRADVAELSPRGAEIVDTLAPVLRDLPDRLEIAGHTNQAKGKPRYYPTDWELSTARAVAVLRRLAEVDRVPGSRMAATGYGHEKPLVDPSKPGSQDVNKRVDIVVLTSLDAESRALIGTVVKDRLRNAARTGGDGR